MQEEKNCYKTILKQEMQPESSLRVFVVFFHPRDSVTAMGGAEKRFVETLKVFGREQDVEIDVLEATSSLLKGPEIKCKRDSVLLGFHGKGWLGTYLEWALWILKAFRRSFYLFRQSRPHVILLPNNTLPGLILGYLNSVAFKVPMSVVVHHVDTPFSKSGSKDASLYSSYLNLKYSMLVSLSKTIAACMTLSLLKRVKGIIAVSNFTAEALRSNGVSGTRIVVSGNAVDLDSIDKAKPHSHEKVFDGVFVGRIAKEKGILDLLRVWKNVVRVRKDAKLLVIGRGLEYSLVKKKICALDLENKVFLRGRCSDTELYSLLKSSRLFIFPSVFEGWGIAVAEALACGLPVVAYDIPALREVFGRCKSVFLVPVKNNASMTSTVLDILNLNKEEWFDLSRRSRLYCEQFSWEKIARKDLELLRIFKRFK
jgi:glycosyltransferase involved in cell wall biosynthesis